MIIVNFKFFTLNIISHQIWSGEDSGEVTETKYKVIEKKLKIHIKNSFEASE